MWEVVVYFANIGGIVDHHCLEMVVYFANIGGIVDHHCLEMVVCFVDICGIDYQYLNFPFIISKTMLHFSSPS